eukprot:UC4_evm2s216
MPWQKRIICEVMNEPNVKVQKCNTTWDTMIDYHITIATRIHHDLKNSSTTYLVGGPTSAFPEDEAKNFTHFRNVLKPFIDKAGKHVDYLSIHLYDTMGLDMDKNPLDFSARSGNNVDAILDLHEGYTSSVIGKVLPHSISEFGTGFKSKSFSYSAVHDWYILRGVVAKVMQFMQRPDRIIKAIPFIVGKATWFKYEPDSSYPFVLWRATSTANGVDNRTWYPTQLHKFYEFFAHVTGCSFYVKSSDANIQVNMFYDDDTGVTNILLNNLKNVSASISIPLIFTNSAIIWQRRRLFFDAESQLPVIEVSDANKEPLPVRVLLAGNEATILTINGTRFSIGDNLLENTHYSSETLVKMISNEQKTFSVPVKSVQLLQATLRVGFSVPDKAALDTKLLFSVSVNNISVPISLETDMGGLAHLSANSGEVFGSFRVDLATAAWTSDNIWLVTISCARSGFISSVVIVTVILRAFTTDAARELDVLRHDSDPFCMNSTEISVLKETNKIRFGGFLKGTDRETLKP